jgi:hypothetical protein
MKLEDKFLLTEILQSLITLEAQYRFNHIPMIDDNRYPELANLINLIKEIRE